MNMQDTSSPHICAALVLFTVVMMLSACITPSTYVGAVVAAAGAEGEERGGTASQGDVDGTTDPAGKGARG